MKKALASIAATILSAVVLASPAGANVTYSVGELGMGNSTPFSASGFAVIGENVTDTALGSWARFNFSIAVPTILSFISGLENNSPNNLIFDNVALSGGSYDIVFETINNVSAQSTFQVKYILYDALTAYTFQLDRHVVSGSKSWGGTMEFSPVPLPPALLLLGSALVGSGLVSWRRKSRQKKGRLLAA